MQGTNTTESYSYDPVGNRLSSLGVASYSYNNSNELTSSSQGGYTYDANGNTLTDASGKSYAWDFENRLKQVTLPNSGGTVTFLYDPFGRRIQKVYTTGANPPTTTTTNYVYDGDNAIEIVDQNGSETAKYTQGQNIDEPLAESTAGTTDFYEQAGLGSVSSLTNTSGALAQTYAYDSFGNVTNSSGNVSNPFRYTGRDFDFETGLYYYRARYYASNLDRFLSNDPIAFGGGVNFYVYVRSGILEDRDSFGLSPSWNWWWKFGRGLKKFVNNTYCSITCFNDCFLPTMNNSACEMRAEGNRPPQPTLNSQGFPTSAFLSTENVGNAVAGNSACQKCATDCLGPGLPTLGWWW